MTRRPGRDVDDHAEVAELLEDVPQQLRADQPWADSSPTNLLDAVGPVDTLAWPARRSALLTVAEHADDAADLRLLLDATGLTSSLPAWDQQPRGFIVPRFLDAELLAEPVHPTVQDVRALDAAALAVSTCEHPDPFVAWHPSGVAYAMCEPCGATWERQACESCGSPVAALHIARTGRARHSNHPEPK